MKFDSGQITVVIAIAAIISPVIVAVVNDIFTYKLKKREFESNTLKLKQEQEFQQHKLDIESQNDLRRLISNFVASANKSYQHIQVGDYGHLVDAKEEFADSASQLFVVLPVVEQKQILTWLNKSQSRDKSEWLDLIIEINSEAPKLLKSINHK